MTQKFKIYKILDSTSSASYWSFKNEKLENDEFIECIKEKEVNLKELKEMFMFGDDLEQTVLFESLLALVESSEDIAVRKYKEKLKEKIKQKMFEYNAQLGELSYTKTYKLIKEERLLELREILELIK